VTLLQNSAEYQPENGITVTFPEAAITNSGLAVGDYYKVYHIHDGATDVTGPFEYTGGAIDATFYSLSVVGLAETETGIKVTDVYGDFISEESYTGYAVINSNTIRVYGAADTGTTNYYELTDVQGVALELISPKAIYANGTLYHFVYNGSDDTMATVDYYFIPEEFITLTCCANCTGASGCTCGCASCTCAGSPIETTTVTKTLDGITVEIADVPVGTEVEMSFVNSIDAGYVGVGSLDQIIGAIDITPRNPDGTVWQPASGEKTTVTVYSDIQADHNGETVEIKHDHNGVVRSLGEVTITDGKITFDTDGFSDFYIVGGFESQNIEEDTYYIIPGTTLELSAGSRWSWSGGTTYYTFSNYNVTPPGGLNGIDSSGANISLSEDSRTLTFDASSSATLGTYTVYYTTTNGSGPGSVTIIILSPQQMFEMVGDQPVYFTCVTDSTKLPNEPMEGGNYTWIYITGKNISGIYTFGGWSNDGYYVDSPEGFLNLGVIAESDALEQNLQGENVIGVIDNGGGRDTLPCINMTDEEWHELLVQFVANRTVTISDGADSSIRLTSEMVNEKLEDGSYRYIMYPYVIKLINFGSNQKGWHVDCCIIDTKAYFISYEYNLPNTAIIQEGNDLIKPNTEFYTPNTENVEVGIMTLGKANVTGDTSVTVYDTNTQSTSEYKFLYWNTSPDGSGTSYNPDDVLPAINSNMTLYAIWNHTQTSGTVKLQKTEFFEDPNDERKDESVSYTFTVTMANAEAGKAYPYTIYNADGIAINQNLSLVSGGSITLKGGEYAVISNVPGGAVSITESVSADSEFDVSWNVGSTTTEGKIVTATVMAGNQTEIICVNTYCPLVADLTIAKTGWNATDVNQSFIFNIDGPDNFKITVTVNGNGKVTIKDLPIGKYTVTEQTEWSWRYTPDAKTKMITLEANRENEVTFENNRSCIYWLSGDSFCTNWWGGENGTVTNRKASN